MTWNAKLLSVKAFVNWRASVKWPPLISKRDPFFNRYFKREENINIIIIRPCLKTARLRWAGVGSSMLRVRIMPRYQEPITLTISIVCNMYYVILENIPGDFSDNTAFLAFKLRTVFKNISRSVRTVPCRAPYPSRPYDPTLVAKQQTMLKLSWNANKHRNIHETLYHQLVC